MEHQEKAPEGNLTKLMEFVLLDFADVPHLQRFLSGLFLLTYIIILMGNGIIFLITILNPGLQTPMYFFLGNFSLLEICYVSVNAPQNAHESLDTKKNDFSSCLCHTNVLHSYTWGHRVLPSGRDGL